MREGLYSAEDFIDLFKNKGECIIKIQSIKKNGEYDKHLHRMVDCVEEIDLYLSNDDNGIMVFQTENEKQIIDNRPWYKRLFS